MLRPNLKANDYATVKLISGEEVLCQVASIDDDSITIKKCRVAVQVGPGQAGLMPLAITLPEDHSICIPLQNVVFMDKATGDFATQYIQSVSKIVMPATGGSKTNGGLIV